MSCLKNISGTALGVDSKVEILCHSVPLPVVSTSERVVHHITAEVKFPRKDKDQKL